MCPGEHVQILAQHSVFCDAQSTWAVQELPYTPPDDIDCVVGSLPGGVSIAWRVRENTEKFLFCVIVALAT